MSDRQRERLRKELKEIASHDPAGDPHQNQMKAIGRLTADSILELIDTLDEIDKSNKKLEQASLNLASKTFWAQVVSVAIALVALLVALFIRNSSR